MSGKGYWILVTGSMILDPALKKVLEKKDSEDGDFLTVRFAGNKKFDSAITAADLEGLLVVGPVLSFSAVQLARRERNNYQDLAIAVLGAEPVQDGFDIGYFPAGLKGAAEARKYFLEKGKLSGK